MKKLFTYSIISLAALLFTGCEKEVISPNCDCIERDSNDFNTKYGAKCNGGTTTSDEGPIEPITDPNNDDYSNRKPSKVKK